MSQTHPTIGTIGRAIRSLDEFISAFVGIAIDRATAIDPVDAHFHVIEPLREFRQMGVALFAKVTGLDIEDEVQVPHLPPMEDESPDQLFERPQEPVTQ